MYGKHFQSTYTGSMVGAGPVVFAVWGYVIANVRDSLIELNPTILAAVIGCSVEDIESAIEYLCTADPRSRSKQEDGCRLVKEGEYIYRVPTHEKYRSIRNDDERREYMREYMRNYRSKNKDLDDVNTDVNSGKPQLAQSDTEADTDTKNNIGASAPHAELQKLYHEILPELPPIRKWTDKRARAFRARWRDKQFRGLDFWWKYFQHVRTVPFLMGKNSRNWQADIDFLLKEDKIVKIMEGGYENG